MAKSSQTNANIKKALCPLIDRPLENCYCTFSASQYVDKTLYYCNGHFSECEIYKTATKKDSTTDKERF